MEDPGTQHKEGCCFTCNKQGHLAHNCPQKPKEKRQTPPLKGRQAEAEDSRSRSKSKAESIHSTSATVKWDKDLFYQMVAVTPEDLKKTRWKQLGVLRSYGLTARPSPLGRLGVPMITCCRLGDNNVTL